MLGLLDQYLQLPTYGFVFETERASLLDAVQRVYTDDGDGDGLLIFAEVGQYMAPVSPIDFSTRCISAWLMLNPDTFVTRAEAIDLANGRIDRAIAHAERPWYERGDLPAIAPFLTEQEKQRRLGVASFAGAYHRVVGSNDSFELRARGMTLMLALETHRARHGAYPEQLIAIEADLVDPLPHDPFTGEHYGYRREGAGTEPQAYVLDSLGIDGEDNGGVYWEGNPQIIEPYDFVTSALGNLDIPINELKPELARAIDVGEGTPVKR